MGPIIVFHDLPLAEAIRADSDGLDVRAVDTVPEAVAALQDSDTLVTNPSSWSADLLAALEAGDWIQSTGIGVDGYPLAELRDRDVTLCNASTLHDAVVSEHVFALALALSRNIPPCVDQQRSHRWSRDVGTEMWDWKGKRLTVCGLGNIGDSVARRGQAFGFEVRGIKRMPAIYSGVLADQHVYPPARLHEVLDATDLLVLTVPLTPETSGMIGEAEFEILPDTATLINVARGAVVDGNALQEALETDEIAAAGLDVFPDEPLPADAALWDTEGVLITPHVAGRSADFPDRFSRLFLENLRRRASGEPLENTVTTP